ncbi:gamma-glutamyltransferase [Verminephrobacter eiseniae]|uniref:gamma-glutamyltransferase n=1 Tax=Verminephrobacter eiseniae TaxID=364317 RepID=UPI00223838E4|nr:gamma-glutamyltransferase [Verminephrobacter eiseniae]MCW5231303.1 gamma-glutamyltransferase [Verminephrobacter eiseniae]MCW5293035.1 gamma-glutamyltransferase [Verminephrobacter eiseniae]MCW8184428.1 gamma-glutamyltransferase [Verminephrobacter eiseniae]MCW8221448.1 gamma-glutamyltransferase [Verminephrobacter eiseniae]MCW8232381.1 gamma-glutamyltransferase [Verminephrobacter eiseniae]
MWKIKGFIKSTCIALLPLYTFFAFAQAQTAAQAPRYDLTYDIISPVMGRNGMVASEQALASRVGLDILQRGGNAVDAAVAVGFALAVVLPNAGNIGGGGFMMIHDAKTGKNVALDFREMAPAKASRDMYLDGQGNVVPGRSLHTHLAVGVPGTVAGLAHALQKYGTMKLSDVIAPAVELAETGYPVSPGLALILAEERAHLGQWESSKAIFFKDGRPLQAGERLVQKDLARSLELIGKQGPAAFYEGEIGQKIVAEMAQHQGLITSADLKNYKVIEREPVVGNYRGYQVVSMPPPSSGGVHIIQMMNILERYPLQQYGANSAQTIHLKAEAMKRAYADRAEYLGDPDFTKVPVKGLTSRAYADELAQKIDPERATPSSDIKPGKPLPHESDQTTHFSVADEKGNLVAATYTLNLNFGSGIVAAGTGIMLNNEMDDFSAKPGVPNAFGLVGGDANAVGPGKRPLSSMSPTFVLKDGKPFLATGSPGGSRIITTTMQTILNVIDHDMNVAEAAVTPRIHHQWAPDQLRIEKGISADTLRILQNMGQTISVQPAMGRTQTIQIKDGAFYGYSDPRNPDGRTLGF